MLLAGSWTSRLRSVSALSSGIKSSRSWCSCNYHVLLYIYFQCSGKNCKILGHPDPDPDEIQKYLDFYSQLCDFLITCYLFFQNDVNVLTVSTVPNKQKFFVGIFKATEEKSRFRIQISYLVVRIQDSYLVVRSVSAPGIKSSRSWCSCNYELLLYV